MITINPDAKKDWNLLIPIIQKIKSLSNKETNDMCYQMMKSFVHFDIETTYKYCVEIINSNLLDK